MVNKIRLLVSGFMLGAMTTGLGMTNITSLAINERLFYLVSYGIVAVYCLSLAITTTNKDRHNKQHNSNSHPQKTIMV